VCLFVRMPKEETHLSLFCVANTQAQISPTIFSAAAAAAAAVICESSRTLVKKLKSNCCPFLVILF